ncbi:unnamed protein product [Mytilus coruscus]|uniref:Uncharacterized protein n=1 Tax=Mytilus coruscus TaxID=42192 RepID=A0A6J8C0H1_MYTCO|nr:unnamed protein product [Mytilus coruscus]
MSYCTSILGLYIVAKGIPAKNKNHDGKVYIENLLTKGEDINARNKWGQTPLQYAAIAGYLQNIETLTKYSGIDVNSRDINGYNALQSLIAANDGESNNSDDNLHAMDLLSSNNADKSEMPLRIKRTFSIQLRKSLQALINAGINVNNQTTFGDGILHRISTREENTPLLKFFIANFPDTNLNLINKKNENFLHVYVTHELLKEIMELFKCIAEYDQSSLRALLSSRDVLGRTPLNLMTGGGVDYTTAENLKTILSYGVSPEVRDTLGNTRPLDTAKRHNSFRCIALLKAADRTAIEHIMTFIRKTMLRTKTFEDILYGLPETIISSCIKSPQNIQTILQLPLNLKDFMNYLLESYYTRSPKYSSEVKSVTFDVNNLVTSLCKQIQTFDSRFEIDCISRTCNSDEVNIKKLAKKRMLRISAAPAEICLMKSLPNNFRQAYVLSKVLKKLCPEIDVETNQYRLEEVESEYVRPRRTSPSELIKSYMLKNSVFYVLDELKMKNQFEDELGVSKITIKMYNFLLRFVDDRQMRMRPYFLSSDINVFEKSKELSFNKTFIFHLQREFSIKLVLGILNEKFTKECLAAKMI